MRDNLAIVKAILSKTVSRGATVGEEEAAVCKAVEMMGKYAIPHSAVASVWPKGWDFTGRRSQGTASRAQSCIRNEEFVELMNKHFKKAPFSPQPERKPEPKPTGTQGAPGTLGNYARQLLLREIDGKPYSYQWIIESIQLRYPNAKTSVASLRWYEAEMRKQGRKVPTNRPAK